MNAQRHQYGALLLNMGGPDSIDGVEEYIFNLLADPDMVRMPLSGLLQKPFARMIARKRAPKVRERYELIGGKSPILQETSKQAELLSQQLDLPVGIAMRYTDPAAAEAVTGLIQSGVTRYIAVPLYPQYSTVSTLSAIKDLAEQSAPTIAYRLIERHYSDPGYITASVAQLSSVIAEIIPELKTHVLFVAHSIPESYISHGDTYADEVEQTMGLIMKNLDYDLPGSLAYQSRVGPVKWRGPALEEELQRLITLGVEQLVVHPLSFVSENLETLYDLDIAFRQQCIDSGVRFMHRVPTLGSSPLYISALAGLIQAEIASWEASNA